MSDYADISAAMDEAAANVGGMLAVINGASATGSEAFAKAMVARLKDLTGKPGTSDVQGPVNPRSVPLAPAAMQYGPYRDGWNYALGRDLTGAWVDVGNEDREADGHVPRYLEYGTRHMQPRPALRPTTDNFKHQLANQIVAEVIKAQKAVIAKLQATVVDLGGKMG